jgi:hypothetical protein
MSTAEVERLYRAMESLRLEVVEYRKDLNGRLRALEVDAAESRGSSDQKTLTRNMALAYIGGIAALTATISTILARM